jgi:ABC-type multidrug transport system fused ATPase/permease subunit
VLGARPSFFDSTPSGRVTSRFSADMDVVDAKLPAGLAALVDAGLGIVTGLAVVSINAPAYLVLVAPLAWRYATLQRRYRAVSTQLKQMEAAHKSPLFSHCREVLAGLETARAYRLEHQLATRHFAMLDDLIGARVNWDATNRWLGLRLDVLGALIMGGAALAAASFGSAGGQTGLMLAYAFKATHSLSFAVRATASLGPASLLLFLL